MNHQDNETTNTPATPAITSPPQENSHPMQSLAVVAIAGFGGAVAGLSMSRRGTPTIHHVQLSNQLPWLWSIGCATFAGVIEFSTLVSPSRLVIGALRENDLIPKPKVKESSEHSNNNDAHEEQANKSSALLLKEKILYWDDNSTATLGDYALGGAFAGAMFKGSQIRPTNTANGSSSSFPLVSEINTTTTTSSSSPSSSSPPSNQGGNNLHGSIQQKRAIGRGKVVTLANKKQYYKKKKVNTINRMKDHNKSKTLHHQQQKVLKQGSETILKNQRNIVNKASFISGLGPGMTLGIIAGLIQIGIGRLNLLMEEYEEKEEGEEINEFNQSSDDNVSDEINQGCEESDETIDEITRTVKGMTTEEIKKEIERLKGGGK